MPILIRNEADALTVLKARRAEALGWQTDILPLHPVEYEGIIRHGADGTLGWTQSLLDGTYRNFWRDELAQRWRIQVRISSPGAWRFTSLSSILGLMGGA